MLWGTLHILSTCGHFLLLPRKANEGTEVILHIRKKNNWWTMEKSVNRSLGITIIIKFNTNIYICTHMTFIIFTWCKNYSQHNRCTLLAFFTVLSINYSHPKLMLAVWQGLFPVQVLFPFTFDVKDVSAFWCLTHSAFFIVNFMSQ